MKSNEVKNEQAIELLADMFDPAIEIASDEEIASAARSDNRLLTAKLILKRHPRAVFELMALSEGVPVDEYECDLLTLPLKLYNLLNRPELDFLFPSQGQKMEDTSFGSAMVNTGGEGK